MKYLELRDSLRNHIVFSLNDIRNLESGFHRRRLNEWQAKGYIRKIVREFYIFTDLALDEGGLYEIANRVYAPSYISLQTALAYYGLIPESPYGITSVTSRKTKSFDTGMVGLHYRTVAPRLFRGYTLVKHGAGVYKMGEPEKVVLDRLYLSSALQQADDFTEMRLDREQWRARISPGKLRKWLTVFEKKLLAKLEKVPDPPKTLSTSPKGVLIESSATLPTTTTFTIQSPFFLNFSCKQETKEPCASV